MGYLLPQHIASDNGPQTGYCVPATVIARHGPLSYLLEITDQQLWRRHVDQVKERTRSPVPTSQSPSSEDTTWVPEQLVPGAVLPTPAPRPAVHTEPIEQLSAIPETTPLDETPQTGPRYPTRDRRAPNYFRQETRFFLCLPDLLFIWCIFFSVEEV